MWKTNLKIVTVGVLTMGFYTFIAQIIPQLESEVPATLDLSAGVTPEALVTAGADLYNGAGGCTACPRWNTIPVDSECSRTFGHR